MTPEQLEEAGHTIKENPNVITVVDRNGNTDIMEAEIIESINLKETDNENETIFRNSSRLKSNNPVNQYENPITF